MHTGMHRKGSPGRLRSSRSQMHRQREVGPFIGGRKDPRDCTQKDRMTRQCPRGQPEEQGSSPQTAAGGSGFSAAWRYAQPPPLQTCGPTSNLGAFLGAPALVWTLDLYNPDLGS